MNAKSSQTATTSNNQSSSGQTNPWAPQQPYLLTAFNGAQTALGQAQSKAQIPTDFTAQYSPDQVSLFQQMLGYGGGNPQIAANSANAGGILTQAGANGAQGGLSKLATYTPGGGTQSNIDAANAYASGQNITPIVQASMRDAINTANEQTLPGIGRAAAGSGDVNSSRTAIERGIVQRGLDNKSADIAATLRGNAYSQGLSLAEQNSEAANNNQLAGILGLVNGGTGAVNAGVGANTGAVGQQGGLYNIAQSGVSGQQAAKQAPLTNQAQQFQANTDDPFAALRNYFSVVGANNWGNTTQNQSQGTGTQTTVNSPSTLAQIGGWTNFIGSLL